MTDNFRLLERAMGRAESLVRGVRPDQLGGATPCTDWDVRVLVNHLVAGNLAFGAYPAAGRLDLAAFGADHLGDADPAERYAATARDALAAWRAGDAAEGRATLPDGSPGPRVLDMFVMEAFLHGWDLAAATGQPRGADPELVDRVHADFYGKVTQQVRDLGVVFGPEVTPPAETSKVDRLAAYLGRRLP